MSVRPNKKGGADWSDAQYFEKLKARCKITEAGCWEWQGFRHKPPRNYGDTSYRGKKISTHRLAYILAKGPIPVGLVVMHKCDNQPCCNPDHLSLGTFSNNNLDCANKRRHRSSRVTHCPKGHEYTPENTRFIRTPKAGGLARECKECSRIRGRERYAALTPEQRRERNERNYAKRLSGRT